MTDAEVSGGHLFETATDSDAMARAVAAAAPTVVERADQAMVQTLDPGLREPVYELLKTLADNKYVLGRRYAEWCTGAPMLESAVAAAAMAQAELGHARSFYPLLRGFPNGRGLVPMEEKGWQQRPTSAMARLDQRFETWPDFIAANLLIDTALTTLLAATAESPYEPLAQRARKILQEEHAHWTHATGWLRRLAWFAPRLGSSGSAVSLAAPPGRDDLAVALARVWDDAFTWFGQSDDAVIAPLVSAGLLSASPDTLRRNLRARLEPVLTESGLAAPLLARPLPWSRWRPAARRLQP